MHILTTRLKWQWNEIKKTSHIQFLFLFLCSTRNRHTYNTRKKYHLLGKQELLSTWTGLLVMGIQLFLHITSMENRITWIRCLMSDTMFMMHRWIGPPSKHAFSLFDFLFTFMVWHFIWGLQYNKSRKAFRIAILVGHVPTMINFPYLCTYTIRKEETSWRQLGASSMLSSITF